jgi:hypothetical protein
MKSKQGKSRNSRKKKQNFQHQTTTKTKEIPDHIGDSQHMSIYSHEKERGYRKSSQFHCCIIITLETTADDRRHELNNK